MYLANYINGSYQAPIQSAYLPNLNPATGQVYSHVPSSTAQDVAVAVEAAEKAFGVWSKTPAAERSSILLKIADLIHENLEALAQAESIDTGKPITLARNMDIPRAAANFHFFATAILHTHTTAHHTDHTALNYTYKQPIGVVGCISPWNLPLYLFTWKIAPALAAGCCVIAKPSELTPMTAYLLGKICTEAGLPAGVLNIVQGLGNVVGQAIVAHPKIKAISFTGGTATGKHIAAVAAPMFKKLSLELGGKNPTIVFADSNFEDAVQTAVRAAFTNQGQICLCGSRIFIERSIYEAFKVAFVAQTKALKQGNPTEVATQIGATVSEAHYHKVLSYIQLAQEEGGTVLCGGTPIRYAGECANGFFIAPTVIENLPFDCRTNQEEIFGAVATLQPFDTVEEVIAYANSTPYGLAASIWTENLKKAHAVAAQIDSGVIWLNCWLLRDLRTPFGGMKQSGVGREGGWEALDFFVETKNICLKL